MTHADNYYNIHDLRSIDGLSTGNTVLETMSPQTGNIIINNLHLSAFKTYILKQVQLVICTVLGRKTTDFSMSGRSLHLLILHP